MDKNTLAVSTFEKIADAYAQHYFSDMSDTPYIDIFLNQLPPKGHVLDIGCGPGQFTQYMMKKDFEVTGIDYSQEMIKLAKQKVPTGHFQHMDMKHMNFEDETFDGLLVAYSIIHIPSEEIPQTLREFHRVLKPNGLIQVIVQKGSADKVVDEPFSPGSKMLYNFFSKQRISEFINEEHFSLSYIEEVNSEDPDLMSDTIIYLIAKK
jgi:ubiquinone/menaquinone biosynthesis C-methylase UbiE